MCHLPVTIFVDGDLHGQPPPLYQQLQAAHAQNSAMAFFGIQGKKSDSNDGTWSFTSNFAFFCKQASETRKGRDLEAKAVEIRQAEGEAVPLLVIKIGTLNRMKALQTWKRPRLHVRSYNP